MAILKRSKKSILGLDIQLGNIETNISNAATNISNEITRAQGAEGTLTSNLSNTTAAVTILNADNTTTGSVDKKLADMSSTLATITNTYTKTEVDSIADAKVDGSLSLSSISAGNKIITETELNLKANSADVYTQSQLDTALSGKADTSAVYSKTDSDTNLSAKANQDTTYTKTETDSLISPKANSADVYTKSESDTNLTAKLDTTSTVSTVDSNNKIVTQNELNLKANISDVYTKSENDTTMASVLVDGDTVSSVTTENKVVTQTELNLKANSADVYTQSQLDTALGNKADAGVAGKIGSSLKTVDEANIEDGKVLAYNATSGNIEFVTAADPAASSIDDTTTASDKTWSSTKINTELGTKANTADVYTQSEIDSKVVASAFGIKYSVVDIDALNALTDVSADELAVNNDDRTVYKYDGSAWSSFYTLDGTHNHDELYYTKSESDTALGNKADTGVSYTKSEADTLLDTKAPAASAGKVGASLVEVDETNKAANKVLAYNDSTSKLEYVDQDGGSIIDDNNSTDTTVYSSNKINAELNTKAPAADTYTKTEVDTAVNGKVNVTDVKSTIASDNKVVTETELALKANDDTTYTKTEVDTAVNGKVNTSDVLTAIASDNKVVTETDIAGFADTSSVYTKTETDNLVAPKANTADVYTKSDIDTTMASVLVDGDTVTTVDDNNKIVTQNELSVKANTADTYTKTETDNLVTPKFDDAVALTAVSNGNKLVTETELVTKVNVSDVKSTIAADNKVVTETDVAQAIATSEANAATAPIIVVDRPTMSTKSSDNLDYVFTFALSRTPHGLVAVNDEITIYNFEENGDASIFENVSLFSDKHGEIAVTLGSTDEEDKYLNTIKVCYLSTETTVTPGTDALHPIIIDAGCDFEAQGSGTTTYALDYSVGSFYRVTFTDGYYTNINYDTAHTDFHTNNDTDYQAFNFNADPALKSQSWGGFDDEVQYVTYNWTMSLDLNSGTIYDLSFLRGDEVGGGGL